MTDTGVEPLTRPDGEPIRALVVDDEATLAELLASALRYEGWQVTTALTGQAALNAVQADNPDVVILDMMLPDMEGMTVLRRLRERHPEIPVIFLTARDAVSDRVAGLRAGADDYVTKPFSLDEVVARARAVLRRAGAVARRAGAVVAVGGVSLDEDTREVLVDGAVVHLTPTEFELLRFLLRNPRRVWTKAQILDRVWHYDFGGQTNVVDLYISYLRKKIDAGRTPMIHTVRGVGFVLKPPNEQKQSTSPEPAAAATGD